MATHGTAADQEAILTTNSITSPPVKAYLPMPAKGLMFDGAESAQWVPGESTVTGEVGRIREFTEKARTELKKIEGKSMPSKEAMKEFPEIRTPLVDARKYIYPAVKPGHPNNQVPRFVEGAVHADDLAGVTEGRMVTDAAINRVHNLLFRAPVEELDLWRPEFFEQAGREMEAFSHHLSFAPDGAPPSVSQALESLALIDHSLNEAQHVPGKKVEPPNGGVLKDSFLGWKNLPKGTKIAVGMVAGAVVAGAVVGWAVS